MQWLRFVLLSLALTILQAGLLANWPIKPDLLLILLVFFTIHTGTTDAVITSFSIGFAADIIGSTMGPKIISFGLLGTLLAHLHRLIAVRKMPWQAMTIFVTGLLTGSLAYLLGLFKGPPGTGETSSFWTIILVPSLYSALVGPFLFLPCAWWMRIKTHRLGRH